jgi:hypothetical protein
MSDYAQQLVDLRQELDALKAALQSTNDADERLQLYARINANLREYLRLLDAGLKAALAAPRPRLGGASDQSC